MGGSHRADSTHEPGHGHGHGAEVELEVAPLPRALLLAVLAAVAVAVVAGVVLLWPDSGKVDDLKGSVGFAVEGATFPKATVDEVLPACPRAGPDDQPDTSEPCNQVKVTVDEGADKGTKVTVDVPPEVSESGLAKGDQLVLLRTPGQDGQPAVLSYFEIERSTSLWLVAGLFAVVVLAVARLRGLMALVGLGFAGAVMGVFMIPALLAGQPAVPVALIAAAVIMYVVLYTTHGLSLRTSAALAGTLTGMALTAGIGWWSVSSAHLTGVVDDGGRILVDVRRRHQPPGPAHRGRHHRRPGRAQRRHHHPGLGRVGAAERVAHDEPLPPLQQRDADRSRPHRLHDLHDRVRVRRGLADALLAVSLYDRSWLDLVGTEEIAEELVRSFASSIGLVLAVPATTAIAVTVVPGPRDPLGF